MHVRDLALVFQHMELSNLPLQEHTSQALAGFKGPANERITSFPLTISSQRSHMGLFELVVRIPFSPWLKGRPQGKRV